MDFVSAPAGMTRPSVPALVRTGATRVLVDPVREGRLRDFGWPYGLRAIVVLASVVYGLAVLLVAFSGRIRAGAELSTASAGLTTLPRAWIWPVIVIVVVALALFQTAVLHGPGWLRILGTLVSLLAMGSWGLRYTKLNGGLPETLGTVAAMVALIVLVVLRIRRRFAWWEFAATWILVATPVLLGTLALNRTARPLGYDLVPVYLQSTVTTLGPIAIPAALAAGLSVAEITVSGTLWATRLTGRFASRRVIYAILGVLVTARLVQAGIQLAGWDYVRQGGRVFLTWLVLIGLFAAVTALLRGLGRTGSVDLVGLPDQSGRLALPLGLAIAGFGLLSVLVVTGIAIASALAPAQLGQVSTRWLGYLSSASAATGYRTLVVVALLLVAGWSARRGRGAVASLFAAVAVNLLATVVRPLTGGTLDPGAGVDAVNLIATGIVVAVVLVLLVRRRLTPARAAGLGGAIVLTFLLGYRDFISDPLGALLGFAGAALVLFGLTWSLLTDSGFANVDSLRYPAPSRVLLVLANSILAVGILAYVSLARDPGATIDLNDFAELGDQVLGTGLLAAAFVAVLAAVGRDQSVV